MAITASVQPESGRIVYAGSDFLYRFQLRFSQEGMDHIVQNRPGSDLDGLVRVWPNTSVPESSWLAGIIGTGFWQESSGPDFGRNHRDRILAGFIGTGFWQDSSGPDFGRKQPACYQFPTFRLGSILPQTSQIILCQTSPDPIEFWLIVPGFGQTDRVRKQAGVQESSGPLLANASKPIRTGCESDPACLLGQLDDWQNPAHKLWLDCL